MQIKAFEQNSARGYDYSFRFYTYHGFCHLQIALCLFVSGGTVLITADDNIGRQSMLDLLPFIFQDEWPGA